MFKSKLRKKILKLREVENFKNIKIDFDNVFDLLKKNNLTKKCIGGYFPVNYEIDDLEGYYDRVIDKLSKKKDILKIGLALSVQKINNVPVTKYDKKLDYIVTDKYIL